MQQIMPKTDAGVYVNLFCNAMAWRMAELFLPLLAQGNSITEFEMGLFSTLNAVTMLLFLIPAGIIADSVSRKKGILAIASVFQVIIQVTFPIAILFGDYLILNVLQGLTIALYTHIDEDKNGVPTYHFVTNRFRNYPAKSPMDMFPEVLIPNDLQLVCNMVDEYYNDDTATPAPVASIPTKKVKETLTEPETN